MSLTWRAIFGSPSLLDPTDNAVLAQVSRGFLAAVVSSPPGLLRAGKAGAPALHFSAFVRSAERLAWARANGCPWDTMTCAFLATGAPLKVLIW